MALAGCAPSEPPADPAPATGPGFDSRDCNGITDADIDEAVGAPMFEPAVVGDAGCFWQEDSVIGAVGLGMGISTWWYRGSDMDTERELEARAGRTLTELSIDGTKGFMAFDNTACSIYVAKDRDVIAWSIQTLNSATLPDLCSIVEELAQLSQQRVN
nr:DUF3558 domain-containing protein [Mycobacterium sp. SMC-4]